MSHRDIFRWVWRRKSRAKQRGGRRSLPGRVVQLMRRKARENPLWGTERIRGELLKQHMGVAKSSVQKYTQDIRRVGPSGQTWGTFLRNHASEIWACDFLQTYDALFRSIFVFVIIELDSRRVGALVLPDPVSVARARTVFDDHGNCLDAAMEQSIRGLAASLVEYIRDTTCPQVSLEQRVRADTW
jgi:hypothetical protein